jgi:hypothetical protein
MSRYEIFPRQAPVTINLRATKSSTRQIHSTPQGSPRCPQRGSVADAYPALARAAPIFLPKKTLFSCCISARFLVSPLPTRGAISALRTDPFSHA